MESIFTSSELYNYIMGKLDQPIPTSLKLSLLFKAIQKDIPADHYMVVIFLNYMRCLINEDENDISENYKSSKLKYFKFWCFWREYMGFLISSRGKVDKVVDEGIRFLNVKEFPDKAKILRYLTSIKNDPDRQKFIYEWKADWMTIDDVDKEPNFSKDNYKSIINRYNDDLYEDKENLGNIKLNNSKVKFTDLSYSPALKKTPKSFPNTPITDDVNKYPYKEEIQVPINNVIKCKIEDITLGEDTNMINFGCVKKKEEIKIQDETSKPRDIFILKEKKLQKINIIGKGGSSKVYKVFYENEFYALKVINIEMDSTLMGLIKEEIKLLMDLQNVEGIIKMIDHQVQLDNIYILLEYGESVLSSFMKIDRSRPDIHLTRVKYIWQEILLIVDKVHDKKIIHGDLKPANFVFVKNKLKIIDFGISKTLNSNTTRLDLDVVCGTVNYCAPELFFENKKRRASDVWSLGIILYELWYGKTPLDSYKSHVEKKDHILNIRENLKMVNKVDEVIFACLNENVKLRPTVKQLLDHEFLTNRKK